MFFVYCRPHGQCIASVEALAMPGFSMAALEPSSRQSTVISLGCNIFSFIVHLIGYISLGYGDFSQFFYFIFKSTKVILIYSVCVKLYLFCSFSFHGSEQLAQTATIRV